MGEFRSTGRDEGEPSWTDETLPIEVRRALLDKALEEFRSARAAAAGRTRVQMNPARPGETGSADRDSTGKTSTGKTDKPQA